MVKTVKDHATIKTLLLWTVNAVKA